MKKIAIILILVLAFCITAHASDIEIDPARGLLQSEFEDMCTELGFAINYMPLTPAAPLGILGFNIGIEGTFLDIKEASPYWQKVTTDSPPDYFPIPKLHIQKGLPFKIDLGAIYSQIAGTNVSLIGGEIKWSLLKGSTVTPAFSLRGSYTRLNGVDTVDLETMGFDASVSKGFAILTPYAGVGQLWIKAEEKAGIGLSNANEQLTKVYAGIKFDPFPLVSLTAEVDYAEIMAYSLRFSANF
ncbi:MAG: hypothetical protein ACMUHX_04265 [bacterium]